MYTDHNRSYGSNGSGGSKSGSAAISGLANAGWKVFQSLNKRIPESPSPKPKWAPGPLLKSYERTAPELGFPRTTDSLCPRCVKEVRTEIIEGKRPLEELVGGHLGEIKAELLEDNGKIVMRKTCEKHGTFEDTLSVDPDFSRRIESLFFGRDFRCSDDAHVHRHGTSNIKWGRGAVLTVDLTNRCNMMCNPCFMDANQVGYVHEPSFDDIKAILDRGVSFKPRRQNVILFSGGEPTLSPFYLEACTYAKKIGYYRILAATNGIRFAEDRDFAFQAKEAGMDGAYLQFDGVTNEMNSHRGVGNLFDVKLQAINNMAAAGMKTTLVVTIVNGINNDHIGKIAEFAMDNNDKIQTIAYQPVSFTGRDEDIDDETRAKQRYTLAQMAHDLKGQLGGKMEPMRDWFPLSSFSAFTAVMDILQGQDADWGWNTCNCHPNCGIFSVLVVNRKTKQWAPLYSFFDYEQFMRDITTIADTARGRGLTTAQLVLSVLRNFDAKKAPEGFPISEIKNIFMPKAKDPTEHKRGDDVSQEAAQSEWGLLTLEGMWFQDLFTYDFRRTEMCVIPYGTQEGEVSFCAYNTGVGWRQIIENMHKTGTVGKWYKEHGRHEIYAQGRPVELNTDDHALKLRPDRHERPEIPDLEPAGAGGCGTGCGCSEPDATAETRAQAEEAKTA